jgi:hypothetical protein
MDPPVPMTIKIGQTIRNKYVCADAIARSVSIDEDMEILDV